MAIFVTVLDYLSAEGSKSLQAGFHGKGRKSFQSPAQTGSMSLVEVGWLQRHLLHLSNDYSHGDFLFFYELAAPPVILTGPEHHPLDWGFFFFFAERPACPHTFFFLSMKFDLCENEVNQKCSCWPDGWRDSNTNTKVYLGTNMTTKSHWSQQKNKTL